MSVGELFMLMKRLVPLTPDIKARFVGVNVNVVDITTKYMRPLFYACDHGLLPYAQWMLEDMNANPNFISAADGGFFPIVLQLRIIDVGVIRLLLRHGMRVPPFALTLTKFIQKPHVYRFLVRRHGLHKLPPEAVECGRQVEQCNRIAIILYWITKRRTRVRDVATMVAQHAWAVMMNDDE